MDVYARTHVPPDAPVDGVEVPDVEGWVGVGGREGVGEEAQPRVVPSEHHALAAAVAELLDDTSSKCWYVQQFVSDNVIMLVQCTVPTT